jgi:DNA (cytosine-5)-methyltransferase 1
MKVLDLFCKAGGAGFGYHLAGHEVVGVDWEPQPNYPFEFHQADVLDFLPAHGHEFEAIHASPCCWGYTTLNALSKREHVRMIPLLRKLLIASGRPWIIENVQNAKADMHNPIMLCGSSFGLRVRRHRLFETSFPLEAPPCDHRWQQLDKRYTVRRSVSRGNYLSGTVPVHGGMQLLREDGTQNVEWETGICREAMGIGWMNKQELNQAIPPAYTQWIGQQIPSERTY